MLIRIYVWFPVVQEIATSPPLWAAPRNDTVVGSQARRFQQLAKLQLEEEMQKTDKKQFDFCPRSPYDELINKK